MKNKLIRLIIMFSKYALLGVVIQLFAYTFLQATDGNAQQKLSVYEVTIDLNINQASLQEVFEAIENKTDYNFLYDKKLLKRTSLVSIHKENVSVGEILMDVSKSLNVKFKQINESINVNLNDQSEAQSLPVEVMQTMTVTGQVLSGEDNSTLPGVNVIIKGTAQGTVTDLDGMYSLDVPVENSVLVFSSVGFNFEEITVGNSTVIDMVLMPDITALDEIVVVGYGTQKNRTVSVAVSQVDSKELEISNRPLPNVQQSLIGAVPGLIIDQTSGRLGASMNIKVRSVSALEDRNALVLIDGFEGSIDDVNPADIESVSVLKDAAATAIYGARSANGVVLITTKNTKKSERLSLMYNFNQSIQKPVQTAELANSVQFIEFSNEATLEETLRNDPDRDPSTISLPFSDEELARAQSGFYPDTKWTDEVYSKNAGQSSHNITITGGSEKTGYSVNLGYLSQNGLVSGSENLKRYNIRLKLDTDITNWFSIGTNVSNVIRNTNNVPESSDAQTLRGRPFFPVQLEDGTYVDKGAAGGEPNPVARSLSGSYDKEERDALNLQLYAQIKPIEDMVIEGRISYTKDNVFQDIWNTPYEYAILDMELSQVGENIPVVGADRNLLFRSQKRYKLNSLVTARYNKQFNKFHNLNILLGFQAQEGESIMVEAERFNYILPTLQDLKLGQEINGFGNSSGRGDNRTTVSYFTRMAYDFKGRYLAEFNFRADASSNFGKNNQWGYFPAISAGWNAAEEPFMSDLNFVDILKIRASWGLNGDDGSINSIEKVDFNPNGTSFGGTVIPTLNLGDAINPDLKWETSEKTNLGLDLNFWQGKLGFTGEYFIDKRSDIITQLLTSVEGGLGGVLDNVYDAKSWGWELNISHQNKIGKVDYFANVNLTSYNSEITNTEGVSPLNNSNTDYQDIGLPILGNWFGYETEGFFNNQSDMDTHIDADGNPIDQSNVVAHGDEYGRYLGGFKYLDQVTVDTNNDGVPDAKDGIINADDRIVLKENANDNYRIGFNLGVSYAGFSLSARFYGVLQGYEWWRSGENLNPFTGDIAPFVYQMDTWRPDNMDAIFPQVTASNIIPFDQNVSHLIQNNSYVKLKNINLGYTFSGDLLDKMKIIRGLELYFSVENLGVIWTNNPAFDTGWDPELGTGVFQYPLPLTTSFGANIRF